MHRLRTSTALLLVAALLLPASPAVAADAPVNLLAGDLDVGFDDPTTRFDLTSSASGGSQRIVDVAGDPAMELRDSSGGASTASYFFKRWTTSALKDRINAVYRQPVGSPSVQFVLSFRLARTATSDKAVAKDVYAQLQFGNFDNVSVPRFPIHAASLTQTAAYRSTTGELLPVTEADIPQYRFTVVPNGGARTVSTVELGFQVRVDTGGTDEAITVDDISIVESAPEADSEPPTAPGSLTGSVADRTATLQWAPSTDNRAVVGYDVLRDGVVAASVGGTTTTAQVQGLMPGTAYSFAVRARDAAGNATTSEPLWLVTPAAPVDHPAPYPGDAQGRLAWLWDRTKAMIEEGEGPRIAPAYTARVLDGQDVSANLAKLKALYGEYDAEQYKSLSKMYAYLMAGDRFSADMLPLVRSYFAQYAYGKLNQTENLRMSNYVVGYLVGQYLPDVVDKNGDSGATLVQLTQGPIDEMIDAGVHRGWAEYESPEYTIMTYLGLNALYQWAQDDALRQRVRMAMDVMWFEWANDWNDGYMISSISRSKGDLAVIGDPTWRPADHTALAWAYFGAHRAQERVGEAENVAPAAYRPNLEVLGYLTWQGMRYAPPKMAMQIGQDTDKDYVSRKANLQNSSGHSTDVYRTTFVRPTWGLGTEVQYRRQDNWREDQPIVLRWRSDAPNPVFRVSLDVGTASIGSYNEPAFHRVMQSDGTAMGVYRTWGDPTVDYLNAMFPDNGAIVDKRDRDGWTFVDAGELFFAFRMVKDAAWHHQTPNDPPNKVKTTASTHPTAGLAYSYDILRSGGARNGWILDTADRSAYGDLSSFADAILAGDRLDTSHVDEAAPRLIYHSLAGKTLDLTWDIASQAPGAAAKIDGVAVGYDAYKLFDTPWLQQDKLGETFTATRDGVTRTYDFSTWTVAETGGASAAPAAGVLGSTIGWDTGLHGGDYAVTMNMWWGENASWFRLFENGVLIARVPLQPSSPHAQSASVPVTGRGNGTYVYTGELVNAKGVTALAPLSVTVKDAAPGKPVLSATAGGTSVTAAMWWGTNATSYRLREDDTVIAEGSLSAHTPDAQRVTIPLDDRPAGEHRYTIDFVNGAGSTTSDPLTVRIGG